MPYDDVYHSDDFNRSPEVELAVERAVGYLEATLETLPSSHDQSQFRSAIQARLDQWPADAQALPVHEPDILPLKVAR